MSLVDNLPRQQQPQKFKENPNYCGLEYFVAGLNCSVFIRVGFSGSLGYPAKVCCSWLRKKVGSHTTWPTQHFCVGFHTSNFAVHCTHSGFSPFLPFFYSLLADLRVQVQNWVWVWSLARPRPVSPATCLLNALEWKKRICRPLRLDGVDL